MSQPQNLFPLSYQGVRAPHPPNVIVKNFDPSSTTANNVAIGDFWINFNPQAPLIAKLWVLLGLSAGVANWVEIVASAGDVLTLTGNSGGAISPVAGNINIVTSGSTVTFIGSGNSLTEGFAISNLLLGSPGTFITSGVRNVGVGQGALASVTSGNDNTAIGFGALTAANGAHNDNTAVGSLALDALTTGASNVAVGSDALGTSTTGINNTAIGTNALTLFTGDNATAVGFGSLASNSTGSFNTAIGTSASAAITTGNSNTSLGFQALEDLIANNNNTAIGSLALNSTTGTANTALGFQALAQVITGGANIGIGPSAGLAYTSTESSNILIGPTVSGTALENNTIRIGTQGAGLGQQNRCFIAGIVGVTASNPVSVVINSATGQLGVGPAGTFTTEVDITNSTASATSPADLNLIKNRTGGPIVAGDQLGCLNYIGYDSVSAPITAGSICVVNPATSTIAANRVAGDMQFSTHPDSASGVLPTLRMTLNSAGVLSLNQSDNDTFGISTTNATLSVGGSSIITSNLANSAAGSLSTLFKSRAGAAVQLSDQIGAINFTGLGAASNGVAAAQISCAVAAAGTVANNRIPGVLLFSTHPDAASGATPTARMQINQNGLVQINTPDTATTALAVTGSISAGGDPGVGTAASTDFTNATATATGGAGAIAAERGGVAITQAGWIKIYVNGVASYVPYYQ